MGSHRRTAILSVFGCLVLLGLLPILSNARPAGSDGLVFALLLTFWQLLAALPLFLHESRAGAGVPLLRGARPRDGWIALATGTMFGLATWIYVVTAGKAGAVTMIIALQAYPFTAMTLEALFQGKRRSMAELGWTVLMVAALLVLVTGGSLDPDMISGWTLLALAVPVLWSVAHLMLKGLLERSPITPNQVTLSRLAISGVVLLVLALLLGRGPQLMAAMSDPRLQLAAVVMGLAYYIELVLWFSALRHVDVSLGSSITVPAPAVTMLVSWMVLGQPIAGYQLAAMAVITLALYGLLLSGRRPPSRSASGPDGVKATGSS